MTDKKRSGPAFEGNDLHKLLCEKLSERYVRAERHGNQAALDTLSLAADMGVSRYTIYRVLNDQKLTKATAADLLRVSGGSITAVDLLPFLMRL